MEITVCKCGKIKLEGKWEYSSLPVSNFIRELCRKKEVVITLVITKCDKCLVI